MELVTNFKTELDKLGLYQISDYQVIRNYFAKVNEDDWKIDPKNGEFLVGSIKTGG